MDMFFCALNCPLHLGGVYKKRTLFKTGTWSSSSVSSAKPLSVLLHIDGDDKLSEIGSSIPGPSPMGISPNNPVLHRTNTIGVIGGVSATSTLNFLGKLIRWSLKDGKETLPFIVGSDSVLRREHSSHGSPYLFLRPRRYLFQFDHTVIVDNLRHKRVFLEQSGARCIVMPCNISHSMYNEVSDGCSVPFLHLAECVAKELKEANLKPVEAWSNVRIGVLATDAALTAGFYQEKLQNQGFEVVLPDKATMEHMVFPAMEALKRKDTVGARNLLRIALQVLLVRAVNTVILASDDIHGLLPWDDPLLKICVDPMDALARSTIRWAQSTEKVKDH